MNWQENTSTSLSSFHVMHSKTLIMPHNLIENDLEYAAVEEKHQQMIQWQVDLLDHTLKHLYSFRMWKTIANVMLLKEPGNFKIHRL